MRQQAIEIAVEELKPGVHLRDAEKAAAWLPQSKGNDDAAIYGGVVSMILTREAILAAQDIKTEVVEVPEWGGAVLVRGLTAAQSEKMKWMIQNEREGREIENFRGIIAAWCIVDESGHRVFSDHDAAALGERSLSALDRVIEAVDRITSLRSEEQIEENFQETPGDASLLS